MNNLSLKIILQAFIIFFFVTPSTAHAYIDPGTSSMLMQVLAAGLVSVLAFYGKIKAAIKRLFSKKDK